MRYNRDNYYNRIRFIIDVYKNAKQSDVPDTTIVRNVFPKHNIYLTYRQWMNIKGTQVPKQNSKQNYNELDLFV